MFWIILIWNVIVFALYGIDKLKAKFNKWRISESTLISCAVIFGGVGAYCGMELFRHKTKHKLFVITVPICAVYAFILLIYLYFGGI